MNLYLVSVQIRKYDDDLNFSNAFTRRVQVISPDQDSASLVAYTALREIYDCRSGHWSCLPISTRLLYSNYKIVD